MLVKIILKVISIHNIRFLIKLMEDIRKSIKNDNILEFKEKFIKEYYGGKYEEF